MKALTAILAIVLVLQTAFTLSLWQEQTEQTSGSQPPPQNNAITTEVKRLRNGRGGAENTRLGTGNGDRNTDFDTGSDFDADANFISDSNSVLCRRS